LIARSAAAFLLIVLSAAVCAAADAPDPLAGIHRVAIVSGLGDGLTLKQDADFLGATADDVVVQTGAGIDAYIDAQIRAAVAGRFEVVDKSQSPDALIVVAPIGVTNRIFLPPLAMSFHYNGLSATLTKGLFGGRGILIGAQYELRVVEPASGKTLAAGVGRNPATGIFHARPEPLEPCDLALWPAVPAAPTDAERTRLGNEIIALIAMSLPNALQAAGLSSQGNDTKLASWNGQPLLCHEFE
jgi:hypothetical protein